MNRTSVAPRKIRNRIYDNQTKFDEELDDRQMSRV